MILGAQCHKHEPKSNLTEIGPRAILQLPRRQIPRIANLATTPETAIYCDLAQPAQYVAFTHCPDSSLQWRFGLASEIAIGSSFLEEGP
jgi:hypothetical protein